MGVAWFRFYAELNDFLRPLIEGKSAPRTLIAPAPVKDLIESFGVPHTEVHLILIDGNPAGFSARVSDGHRVSAYPVFRSLHLGSLIALRPPDPDPPKFVLDVHLGRLAAYVRMLGFDALYSNTASDPDLESIAAGQNRILLTRDRHLLMRSQVVWGYWVRSADPREQLQEVVRRFNLTHRIHPFTRCLECNRLLEPESRDSVLARLPPRVRAKNTFRLCPGCGKLYWEGTHWERMRKIIDALGAPPATKDSPPEARNAGGRC